MNILWVNKRDGINSQLKKYMNENSSFNVTSQNESSVNVKELSALGDIDAVIYETSLENVHFEFFIHNLKKALGDKVPVIAEFNEELSADLDLYFMCKFDEVLVANEAQSVSLRKVDAVVNKSSSVKRILLMEDDRDLAGLLMDVLKNDRIEIHHAEKGYDAIKMCQQQCYDLLITDLVVEGINGFELVNYVNSSHLKQKPEIIVISGAYQDGVKNYVSQLDVKNFFDKPFDMSLFQNKVNNLLYD